MLPSVADGLTVTLIASVTALPAGTVPAFQVIWDPFTTTEPPVALL